MLAGLHSFTITTDALFVKIRLHYTLIEIEYIVKMYVKNRVQMCSFRSMDIKRYMIRSHWHLKHYLCLLIYLHVNK